MACGNYIPKREEEDVFASGSDAVGVRVALKKASMEDWCGASVDIKTAFLNAPLLGEKDADGEGKKGQDGEGVDTIPPPLLIKLKYVKERVTGG